MFTMLFIPSGLDREIAYDLRPTFNSHHHNIINCFHFLEPQEGHEKTLVVIRTVWWKNIMLERATVILQTPKKGETVDEATFIHYDYWHLNLFWRYTLHFWGLFLLSRAFFFFLLSIVCMGFPISLATSIASVSFSFCRVIFICIPVMTSCAMSPAIRKGQIGEWLNAHAQSCRAMSQHKSYSRDCA